MLTSGLHLAAGTKGINEKWEQFYKDLFENEEFSSYKAEHYKGRGSRKIRDKSSQMHINFTCDSKRY